MSAGDAVSAWQRWNDENKFDVLGKGRDLDLTSSLQSRHQPRILIKSVEDNLEGKSQSMGGHKLMTFIDFHLREHYLVLVPGTSNHQANNYKDRPKSIGTLSKPPKPASSESMKSTKVESMSSNAEASQRCRQISDTHAKQVPTTMRWPGIYVALPKLSAHTPERLRGYIPTFRTDAGKNGYVGVIPKAKDRGYLALLHHRRCRYPCAIPCSLNGLAVPPLALITLQPPRRHAFMPLLAARWVFLALAIAKSSVLLAACTPALPCPAIRCCRSLSLSWILLRESARDRVWRNVKVGLGVGLASLVGGTVVMARFAEGRGGLREASKPVVLVPPLNLANCQSQWQCSPSKVWVVGAGVSDYGGCR
ncbi:uncharacterized protein MYCFIDRAFT_172730 [Pseudocercospora fijiensis CIRAD86]|uniref:Uncharacterized protein n=1 Tax=Pseudocercospora fijiensis (strain CIRAD86) TaxID=383855 RepID=M3BD26_PSEFD|nr:uncharacterized protein MYCFIDRAFT_172730 [Pseudocercospora fijiensis CIRAD86]EME87058.1 hypothetical protein MYCFIDRAFT_172730 [Pseudocercospora fijiensis CIRAD86]